MKKCLVETADGSLSMRDVETGELFHNRAGAYSEALVNYVHPSGVLLASPGTDTASPPEKELNVLDVCFGLGYNSLVLLAELAKLPNLPYDRINITAIEIEPDVVALIPEIIRYHEFDHLVQSNDGKKIAITFGANLLKLGSGCDVQLHLVQSDLRKELPQMVANRHQLRPFDLIFHDPFSPRRSPELWTQELFDCYYQLLHERTGKVLTYSIAVAVRAGLVSAGFKILRSTALGGKSGGTIAYLGDDASCDPGYNPYLFHLDESEHARLDSASAVPYKDPSFADTAASILARRAKDQMIWKDARTTHQKNLREDCDARVQSQTDLDG